MKHLNSYLSWAEGHGLTEVPNPAYVSLYTVARCYGGPEEGGWWYDLYTLERYKRAATHEEAESLKEAMSKEIEAANRDYENNKHLAYGYLPDEDELPCPSGYPEGYIPTGWSDGEKLVVFVEECPGESATKEPLDASAHPLRIHISAIGDE